MEALGKKELAYALALRAVKPLQDGQQMTAWRDLVAMICEDYVRSSRWDEFKAIAQRGA